MKSSRVPVLILMGLIVVALQGCGKSDGAAPDTGKVTVVGSGE